MRFGLLISESCHRQVFINVRINNLLDVRVRRVFTFYQKCQWSQAKRLSLGSRPSSLIEVGEEVKLQYEPGSAITNGREPRSCLDRVFNSKLGCFATLGRKCIV
jgi:hypothetical protein